jgi:hypothetical protein
MTVVVQDTTTRFRMKLAPGQEKLFLDELNSTQKRNAGKLEVTSEPRYVIEARLSSGRKAVYHLFDRTVVMDARTGKVWPFYFGLLLSEWLNDAQPRPTSSAPFDPAVP